MKDVGWLAIAALSLTAVMALLGYVVTDLLPSSAVGRWDADVPRRLLEYRQNDEVSESKIITTLSATPTIVILTVLAAIVFRWMFGRWRESLVVICAVVGETAIFMATTMLIDRPRPSVSHMDVAPPTSSFPSGHTAAAVCFYGSIAAIVVWHSTNRWVKVVAVISCAAVPLTIAASRIYRGMHYPTDVLAGALLGALWLSIVVFFVHRRSADGHPDAVLDADARLVKR